MLSFLLGLIGVIIALVGWYGSKSLPLLIIGTVLYFIETFIERKNLNQNAKKLDIIIIVIGCIVGLISGTPFYIPGMLAINFYSAIMSIIGVYAIITALKKKRQAAKLYYEIHSIFMDDYVDSVPFELINTVGLNIYKANLTVSSIILNYLFNKNEVTHYLIEIFRQDIPTKFGHDIKVEKEAKSIEDSYYSLSKKLIDKKITNIEQFIDVLSDLYSDLLNYEEEYVSKEMTSKLLVYIINICLDDFKYKPIRR